MKSRRVASFAEEGKWTSGPDATMLVGDWQAWVDGEGHWKVRGPDPDNEAHYADGDIELTEAEYIEAGNSAARRKIRAARAKKAARAYIQSMRSTTRHHATKKKSSAQLEREIAEALSKSGKGPRPSKLGGDYFTVELTRAKPEATNEWNRLPAGWDSQTRGAFPTKHAAFKWAREKLLRGAPFTIRYVPLGQ